MVLASDDLTGSPPATIKSTFYGSRGTFGRKLKLITRDGPGFNLIIEIRRGDDVI